MHAKITTATKDVPRDRIRSVSSPRPRRIYATHRPVRKPPLPSPNAARATSHEPRRPRRRPKQASTQSQLGRARPVNPFPSRTLPPAPSPPRHHPPPPPRRGNPRPLPRPPRPFAAPSPPPPPPASDLEDFRPRWRTGVSASLPPLSLSGARLPICVGSGPPEPMRAVRFCDGPPSSRRILGVGCFAGAPSPSGDWRA